MGALFFFVAFYSFAGLGSKEFQEKRISGKEWQV
jgi:hypothetical protein